MGRRKATRRTDMGETGAMSRSREAWAELGREFADIARRFQENYESVSDTVEEGTDESRKSIDQAVEAIRRAVGDLAESLSETLKDPKVRSETEEAGTALVKAFGVTLSEIGETLQRDAKESAPPTT
jgi:hypothetical protein